MTSFKCLQCKAPVIDTRPPELYGDEINHLCTECDRKSCFQNELPALLTDHYIPCPEDDARQLSLDELIPSDV